MAFDLAAMTKRAGTTRRKVIPIPLVYPTQAFEAALAAIYVQVVRTWAEAAKTRILPAYERTAAPTGHIRDDVPEIEREIEATDEIIRRLILTLTPELRKWAIRVESHNRMKWRGAVLRATGIDLATMIGPEDEREVIEAFLARNTALIRDVSAQARGKIADAVFRGVQARNPAAKVAKEVREVLQSSRRRATNIAADQMQKVAAALDQERRRQLGIDTWVWRHSAKRHPRATHVARDGKEYTDATAPADLPGFLPHCGCRAQAVLHLD